MLGALCKAIGAEWIILNIIYWNLFSIPIRIVDLFTPSPLQPSPCPRHQLDAWHSGGVGGVEGEGGGMGGVWEGVSRGAKRGIVF